MSQSMIRSNALSLKEAEMDHSSKGFGIKKIVIGTLFSAIGLIGQSAQPSVEGVSDWLEKYCGRGVQRIVDWPGDVDVECTEKVRFQLPADLKSDSLIIKVEELWQL